MNALRRVFLALLISCLPGIVQASEGLVVVQSQHDVATTADRLEAALVEKGMTIMNRIDHAGGAASAGLELRPTQLVIFGNPRVGTPLMQCAQGVAIDLPQKALIWEDANGEVWLGYNDPQYLSSRHGIEGCDEVLARVSGALANFAKAATGD